MAAWDEDGEPSRSAAELVAGLEASWQVIQDALARWTPADLEQAFSTSLSGKIGPHVHASISSGMCSNTTSITAANSPPSSAHTAWQQSI